MKTRILNINLLALIIFLISGCSDQIINGSNELVTYNKSLPSFTKIVAHDIAEVTVVKGDSQLVDITVNSNLRSQINTIVRNNTLTLSLKDGSYRNVRFVVNIQVPNLDRLELDGDTEADVDFITDQLEIECKGSSELDLQGSSDILNVDLHHSGSISGFSFITDVLNTNSRDGSELDITVNSELNGSVREGAVVRYRGNPEINATTREAGRIENANFW